MLGSQIILTSLIVVILLKTFFGLKKRYLPFPFMLFWLGFWLGVLLMVLNPFLLSYVARLLGIGRGVDLAVYSSIILIFYLIYVLFVRITNLERKIIDVVRKETLKKS